MTRLGPPAGAVNYFTECLPAAGSGTHDGDPVGPAGTRLISTLIRAAPSATPKDSQTSMLKALNAPDPTHKASKTCAVVRIARSAAATQNELVHTSDPCLRQGAAGSRPDNPVGDQARTRLELTDYSRGSGAVYPVNRESTIAREDTVQTSLETSNVVARKQWSDDT